MYSTIRLVLIALILTVPATAFADPVVVVRSASGVDPASIQAEVHQFRADLGGPNNGVTPGSQPGGRREITWDGGGAAAPATLFANPMTAFSNRGNVYTTPGGSFEISGAPSPEFGDVNPQYPNIFKTFSSPRLFAPLGSNITDVFFTIPGSTDSPALVSGFGAVFSDVDLANTTSIEFFNAANESLGLFFAPSASGNETLSFLGVSFGSSIVSRVRIVTGNAPLSANNTDGFFDDIGVRDIVVMDDFIFGEPQAVAQPVPEPTTMVLMGSGLAGLAAHVRRRRKRQLSEGVERPR